MPGSMKPELPALIGQPLRDIMRGVAMFADLTEETLAPAKRFLPDPIRSNFRSVLTSLEDVGHRVVTPEVSHSEIQAAAYFVTSTESREADRDALGKVLAYAWERCAPALTDRRFLFSEVVTGRHLATLSPAADRTRFLRAAELFESLRLARPVSVLPAVDLPMRDQDLSRIATIMLSIFVWLVSDRADSFPEEERLLNLAIALTMAKEDQIAGQIGDVTALSQTLQDFAKYL